jgi:acetyl esterase/lipase
MDRRDILKFAAVGCASIGISPVRAALAATPDDAILATVNPQLREAARTILKLLANSPPLNSATLAKARGGISGFASKPMADVPYEKRTIPGLPGQPDVVVFVINAKRTGEARPGILHTHGGGFVMGSAEQSLLDLQKVCRELDCVALTVEYRLAPETRFTGSIADNYAGLKWLHTNAAQLGVDPQRIAVMGESAGGGHAALLAITARDRGEVPLCFACLTYPMLDDRTGTSQPAALDVGQIIWTAQQNRFGWESFLGLRPGGRFVPRNSVPARVDNLRGLPPTWIGVGTIDLFRNEDIAYARRLNDAGVPTELIVVPGAFHGFDSPLISAEISKWFVAARLSALRRAFAK